MKIDRRYLEIIALEFLRLMAVQKACRRMLAPYVILQCEK
jgi:hypothetical protein